MSQFITYFAQELKKIPPISIFKMEYRLNKYISASGYCSRREADKYIEEGNVSINGRRASVGDSVLPGQRVYVNGHLVEPELDPVYIAFNKPVGVVSTTNTTEKGNMVDFIQHEQRIFPIGRLDKDSQGLILLTNDGDVVNKILRVGNKNKKEYIVTVDRPVTDEFLHDMANGVPILDRVTRKCELEKINPTTFKITLTQGLNRQIRRMCEYFHYNVVRLERTKVMNIELGKLGQGNWRDLTEAELDGLAKMIEGADGTEEGSKKRKSPSTLKHQAARERKINDKIKADAAARRERKRNGEEEEPAAARSKKGNPKAKRSLAASGERIGKMRPDKVARKTRTREINHARRGGQKK